MRVVAWTAGVAWFLICTSLSYARFARRSSPPVVVQHGALAPPLPVQPEPAPAPANAPAEPNEPDNPAWDHSLDAPPEHLDAPSPAATTQAPSAAAPATPASALPAAPVLPSAPPRTLAAPPVASGLVTGPPATPGAKRTDTATTRKPKAHKESASKSSAAASAGEQPGAALEPAARCLECGAPAASWVEVDGKRIGYCRKHYSKMDRPRASRKRSKAQASEPATPSDRGKPAAAAEASAPAQQESKVEGAPSVQCRGLTKDGTRCRRKTKDPSGFCYQHRPR